MPIIGPLPETVYCWEMNSEKDSVPVSKNDLNEDDVKRLSKGGRISLSAARPVQLQMGTVEWIRGCESVKMVLMIDDFGLPKRWKPEMWFPNRWPERGT